MVREEVLDEGEVPMHFLRGDEVQDEGEVQDEHEVREDEGEVQDGHEVGATCLRTYPPLLATWLTRRRSLERRGRSLETRGGYGVSRRGDGVSRPGDGGLRVAEEAKDSWGIHGP